MKKCSLALPLALCAGLAVAGDSIPSPFLKVDADLDPAFQSLAVDANLAAALSARDRFVLEGYLLAPGRAVDLSLERTTSFAPDAVLRIQDEQGERALPMTDSYDLFRGSVVGIDDSYAVLTLSDSMVAGIVQIGDDTFILSSGPTGLGLDPVAYQLNALPEGLINFLPFQCDAEQLDGYAKDAPSTPPLENSDNPCRVIETAIETDTQYLTDLFGSNVTAATQYTDLIVTANSEIYTRDLNVTWQVNYLKLWDTGSDPWNQGSTVDQLYQFRDYWVANAGGIARDNAHFFSGRGLGGGVAWVGAICYEEYSYALSANLNGFFPYPLQDYSGQNWDMMVTSHEWGHNVGSPHTHSYDPPIDNCGNNNCSSPLGTIMSYCHLCSGGLSNIRLGFANRVIDHVSNDLFDYACVPANPCGSDCPADLTGSSDANSSTYGIPDGDADGDDFFFYLDAFAASNLSVCDLTGSSDPNDPSYDNPDGDCDGDDFFRYLELFAQGCP